MESVEEAVWEAVQLLLQQLGGGGRSRRSSTGRSSKGSNCTALGSGAQLEAGHHSAAEGTDKGDPLDVNSVKSCCCSMPGPGQPGDLKGRSLRDSDSKSGAGGPAGGAATADSRWAGSGPAVTQVGPDLILKS